MKLTTVKVKTFFVNFKLFVSFTQRSGLGEVAIVCDSSLRQTEADKSSLVEDMQCS